jgi:transposase-like protein
VHPKSETQKIGTPYSEGRCPLKGKSKRERRTEEFKKRAVQRMLAGEPVSRLSRQLKVRRSLLYRWHHAYRKEGTAGFRPIGRPGWSLENKAKEAEERITELECKIGQQAMVIDFLRRAFKRVGELRQPSKGDGGTASMERSKP